MTDCGVTLYHPASGRVGRVTDCGVTLYHPASGRVGRVTDCGVRSLGFKSRGSILTSRTETSSPSQLVSDGWDPCSVQLSGYKKSHAVESSTWPLNSHNCSENKTKKHVLSGKNVKQHASLTDSLQNGGSRVPPGESLLMGGFSEVFPCQPRAGYVGYIRRPVPNSLEECGQCTANVLETLLVPVHSV